VTGTGRLLYRADQGTQSGQTMQAAAGGEPREVRLVAVKLESVGLHPFRDSSGALSHSGQERVNVALRTGTVNLRVVRVQVRRQFITFDEGHKVRCLHDEQDWYKNRPLWYTEPSIRRVWPTVVPAQCRMTSLLCPKGRHLDP